MVISTVRKVGNSFMVVVPRDELERLGVALGDVVSVEVRPVVVETKPRLSPADEKRLARIFRQHGDTLRRLTDM